MNRMHLRLRASPDAPRASRAEMAGFRQHLEPRFDDVALVLSELVTNSVRHASTDDVEVSVLATDRSIRVEVTDDGPGFDPSAHRVGLGLTIVERVAAAWGVRLEDRCTVWVELAKAT